MKSRGMQKVIIVGAGGHGKVIADIVMKCGAEPVGFLDDGLKSGTKILGLPILGKTANIPGWAAQGCQFLLAIGSNQVRRELANRYRVEYFTAIHPGAVIGAEVEIGAGTVIMAGAVVNPGARVGQHCILNTGCVVEHDNILEDFVHICPRAALAGTVKVGALTQIGVGACVRNNVSIACGCLIGAGAAVVSDITTPGTYAGVPARLLK